MLQRIIRSPSLRIDDNHTGLALILGSIGSAAGSVRRSAFYHGGFLKVFFKGFSDPRVSMVPG